MKIWKILGLTAVAAASLYALAACAAKPDAMDDKATASITSYNHTPDYISSMWTVPGRVIRSLTGEVEVLSVVWCIQGLGVLG